MIVNCAGRTRSIIGTQSLLNTGIPNPVAALRNGTIDPTTLTDWLDEPGTRVLDFTASANYAKRHIPGAAWVLRSQLKQALERLGTAERYVLTCGSNLLARFAVAEVQALSGKPVFLLDGGTSAWVAADLPTEDGESLLASPRIDRYRRPCEGTDNPREAMQGYLDWEFGLVEQFGRDGTHGFFVIRNHYPAKSKSHRLDAGQAAETIRKCGRAAPRKCKSPARRGFSVRGYGGGGEIRTHGRVSPSTVFKFPGQPLYPALSNHCKPCVPLQVNGLHSLFVLRNLS